MVLREVWLIKPEEDWKWHAIVVLLDELRDAVRDARNRRIDVALGQLDDETDLGLWLLETLNELEAAETALAGAYVAPTRRIAAKNDEEEPAPIERMLTYEQFMAGRRVRSELEGLSRSSLAGSHVSYIRGFLNRLIGVVSGAQDMLEKEDAAHKGAFDRGDEIENAEDALEAGIEFTKTSAGSNAPAEKDKERATRARQRRANREQLIDAVAALSNSVVAKVKQGGLRCVDLLRLRAIPMIIASAGWDGKTPPKNSLQVLLPTGDMEGTWPRLIGKALFAYFGGRRSAIATLVVDDLYDQIPDDILECWASCIWAIHASLTATSTGDVGVVGALESVRTTIYRVIALRREEMLDPAFLRVLDGLSTRFAKDLGCDRTAIRGAHMKCVTLNNACRSLHCPRQKQAGRVRTWVNSRWKYPPRPGQLSVEINTLAAGASHVRRERRSHPPDGAVVTRHGLTYVYAAAQSMRPRTQRVAIASRKTISDACLAKNAACSLLIQLLLGLRILLCPPRVRSSGTFVRLSASETLHESGMAVPGQ